MQKLSSIRLPWPTDWAALFGAERPLILEIGFGYGAFLKHLARTNPDANIVGIEIANQCLASVERAVEREKLTNVRIIQSMAETALHHLFTPATLSQVHINFPDPWFKSRHSHRRLMQRDTLDVIVSRLQPEAALYLATDIIEYAEMSAELLASTPGLDNVLPTPWANAMVGRVVTKYEGRAQREGRACYYFAYRRNAQPAPEVPVIVEGEMTHVVFKTPLSLDDILARFEGVENRPDADTIIKSLHSYRGDNVVMFEMFTHEPTIDQHYALVVSPRENDNEYTLKVGTLGYPRHTPGLQKAVAFMGDWLVRLHPDAVIVHHKLGEY
ncbi:MAG: tRNA (guanosine(46)-N7)-methyltransferase TrmB [Chloroflexi bacterium]|nr:tRNA (guanosine(46)-N7)-methyltransferase TrmB [Chloroflexota bacterium]MCC6893733.1 tRNA (guanosine(46)-N7)-methyltransferase TrmB [Anaerolineae bacterium]